MNRSQIRIIYDEMNVVCVRVHCAVYARATVFGAHNTRTSPDQAPILFSLNFMMCSII